MKRAGIRTNLTRYPRELELVVDRKRAAFSAWYEIFPRSMSDDPQRHGTFDDVIAKLPYVRDLGFDVLYFPPIHPIGRTNRKGKNNTLNPGPDDPGSPYAIGSEDGGHDALHPELGTFDDFARLIAAAREHGLEIAIDFAINCSPDHPWIKAASRMVRLAAGRHHQIRREPAEEIRGHRQRPLLPRRAALDLVRAARHRALLGRARRQDLPRRQPAHQADAVLGMDDPRGAGDVIPTRSSWPRPSPGRR